MRRIVSVWLIDWPVTVWRRSAMRARRPASPPDPALDPQNPFALILKNSRGAAVIHALNPAARRAGLRRGQTQADARAMIPHLIGKPADTEADARALRALAVWAERWSPSVSLDPSGEGLEAAITRYRDCLEPAFHFRGKPLPLAASFGGARALDEGDDPNNLLELADQRMYAAKRAGKQSAS